MYELKSEEQSIRFTSTLMTVISLFKRMNYEWMNTYIYIAPVKQKSSEALAAE